MAEQYFSGTIAACFGEILWDVLPDEKVPGGAPMNVCYHLNRLRQNATIISKAGNDKNGRNLLEFLKQQDIDTSLIQLDEMQETGTVIAIRKGNEMEYDIIQPVAWDFIDSPTSLLNQVSKTPYFICGSLAARSERSRNSLFSLLDVAQTKIVDINLRPPHYTKDTVEKLFEKSDVLKLNNHELDLITGWYTGEKDFEKQALFLSRQFSIPTLIITKGEAGAALLFEKKWYNHPGYRALVQDTIGSGDAFLAGYLSQYIKGEPPQTSLDIACRLGAFVASKKGACPPYEISDIERMSFEKGSA